MEAFRFVLVPAHKPEELHDNMRSAIARNLPIVAGTGPANSDVLSIMGGGPSLEDTYRDATGCIAAINGSHAFLLDKGVMPNVCGVCDPSPHMADIVVADPGCTYFLASIVHPSVYDKLLNAGCCIYRWNMSSVPGGDDLLDEIEPDWFMSGGGSTMGLRWITLGYNMGFRKFHLHGMDSSFREKSSHAYPDHQDAKEWIGFEGFQTRVNFIGQVADFLWWLDRFKQDDVEPVEIRVFGEGLLQTKFAQWKARNPGCHEGNAKPKVVLPTEGFTWPPDDKFGVPAMLEDVRGMHFFIDRMRCRRVAVQAGGNVGIYPAHLARHFEYVHTFEPLASNYEFLTKNIQLCGGNIRAYHAALGERDGACSLKGKRANCGAVRVTDGADVQMRTIDGMGLAECDLIWLDIEGYELNALKGAEKTIERCKPAVIIEENALSLKHGLPEAGAREWLKERGYRRVTKFLNDTLYMIPDLLQS